MRRTLLLLAIAALGCDGGEALAPTVTCAPTSTQPPSGWPSQVGVLSVDAGPPAEPFVTAPHRPLPTLDVASARVLAKPAVVSIVTDGDPLADTLLAFSDDAAKSPWWDAVGGEYGIARPSRNVRVRGPAVAGPQSYAQMRAYIEGAIAGAGAKAAADGQTIYLLFLPPDVEVINGLGQQNCGCVFAGGAHTALVRGRTDSLAWVQRCRPNDIEGLTATASHELIESASDPDVSTGYVTQAGDTPWTRTPWMAIQMHANELSDWCEGSRVHLGSWEYARSWSNEAAATGGDPCVPAVPEPYFNVTSDEDWYAIAAGATVSVELRGWSTGPREEWFLYPRLAASSLDTADAGAAVFSAAITADEGADADGVRFAAINNGKKATLTVTAPDAPSGTWVVVRIVNRPASPKNDILHTQAIGFYIP